MYVDAPLLRRKSQPSSSLSPPTSTGPPSLPVLLPYQSGGLGFGGMEGRSEGGEVWTLLQDLSIRFTA